MFIHYMSIYANVGLENTLQTKFNKNISITHWYSVRYKEILRPFFGFFPLLATFCVVYFICFMHFFASIWL